MIKRLLAIVVLILIALGLLPLFMGILDAEELSPVAQQYVETGPEELGAANVVTAVVVSYRGLDTLGEVSVLFVATAGITVVLQSSLSRKETARRERRNGSELLKSGAGLLFPLLLLFGVYIFINGHLSPGGGFQGGVVIASAVVLLLLAESDRRLSLSILHSIEALSGAAYAGVGLLGIWLAAGFLDPRFLPTGKLGELFSAGAIPIIYSLIGLKVGSELTGVVNSLRRRDS
ncbi:MAG: hydrogen gas-evolving membrane-bound hydrogenase subunit E [Spirochaetota bacterium]